MLKAKLLIFSVCTLFALCGTSFARDWHGITPLRSTRQDVERMLGPSSYGGGYFYETKDEKVFFTYSTGECKEYEWDVPRDTVVMIIVYPKVKPLLSNLQLDRRKYQITRDCNPGSFHYTNEDEGISYAVDRDLVAEIIYYPKANDTLGVSKCRSKKPS